MNLGNAIVKMRKKKKIKAKQLADAIGLSATSLSQIENGHAVPQQETLSRIAAYFKIDVDIIYMLATDPDNDMDEEYRMRFKTAFPDFHETLLSFIK